MEIKKMIENHCDIKDSIYLCTLEEYSFIDNF